MIRCAVVTMAPFPVGNVSTLRFTSYLKALAKREIFSYVLVYCPTKMAKKIKEQSGMYEGIFFQYATKITWSHGFLAEKIFFLILGLLKSAYYIKKNRITTLILYGDNHFFVTLYYKILCMILGIKMIGDRSELPALAIRTSRIRLFFYELKQRFFDGMIIMTKQLMSYYSKFFKNESTLFFLPMTIDAERFKCVERETVEKEYIAVVFGTHNRDGLLESIQAFAYYKNQLCGKFDLVLIGNFEGMPNFLSLKKQIQESSISNHVHIMGLLDNNLVPQYLKNASCLLTTPNSYVSGGFPTKLGEYMLSGVPIVATKAGELLDYVTPSVDLFVSEPGDIESIASNILAIEKNPSYAQNVAENARKKALTVFNAEFYIDDLISFMKA